MVRIAHRSCSVSTPSATVRMPSTWAICTMVFTMATDLFPSRMVGSVSGFGGFVAGSVSIVAAELIGRVLDTDSTLYAPIFIAAGLLYPLALGAVSAVELLRDGHEVTILEPGDPGMHGHPGVLDHLLGRLPVTAEADHRPVQGVHVAVIDGGEGGLVPGEPRKMVFDVFAVTARVNVVYQFANKAGATFVPFVLAGAGILLQPLTQLGAAHVRQGGFRHHQLRREARGGRQGFGAIGGGELGHLAPGARATLVAIEDVGRTLPVVAVDSGIDRPDDCRCREQWLVVEHLGAIDDRVGQIVQ